MNLQIVDQFTDFLCSFSTLTSTTITVKILKWASGNPPQAKELIDSFAKLNTTAKRDFSLRLLAWGTAPAEALEQTIKWQKEQHDRRSILSTVLAAIRKGGEYDYILPNGVHCRIAKRADEYFRFTFCVCGKNVVVVYHSSLRLGEALDNLKYNQVYGLRMMEVCFDGHDYSPGSAAVQKIFDAVSKNVDPYVHAVVEK
jgi:hypothetical protein